MSKASDKKKRARAKALAKARNIEHNAKGRKGALKGRPSRHMEEMTPEFIRRSLAATGGTRGRRRVQRAAT